VLKSKKVLTIVLLALVLSAFTASAEEIELDGWQFVEVEEGVEVYFYQDGERVTGVANVPLVKGWWPAAWGEAPERMYYAFDEVTGAVRSDLAVGLVELGDNWYSHMGGGMIRTGWVWCEDGDTMHYMQPAAATGDLVLTTDIPASWTYDQERVTHRWFNFTNDNGALIQNGTTTGWQGVGENRVFYFGHGVTQGWVYDAGNLFFFGTTEAGKPILATGGTVEGLYNPWTDDRRDFTFAANGAVARDDSEIEETLNFAVESFLPGITFIIIEPKDAEVLAGRAFRLYADGLSISERNLFPQEDGSLRIAVEGEFAPEDIRLDIIG